MAVGILTLVGLGEHGFGKNRRHAEESGDPKPEKGTGAARNNGRGRPRDVTRAHLGRNRGRQGLERAHTGFICSLTEKRGTAEEKSQREPEFSHLHKTQSERIKKPGSAQERNQAADAPEYAVDVTHEVV